MSELENIKLSAPSVLVHPNSSKEPTKIVKDSETSRHYFQSHSCKLPLDKIPSFNIKCSRLRKCWLYLTTVCTNDVRALNMYRSYKALCDNKYKQYKHYPFSIHPFSKLRLWLEAVFVVIIVLSNVLVALHFSELDPGEKDFLFYFMNVIDFIYAINIFANFFTGYVEGDTCQRVVFDLKWILFNYLKTWLIIDLTSFASVIPKVMKESDVKVNVMLESAKILRLPILYSYVQNCLVVTKAGIVTKTAVELALIVFSYLTWNIYFQFAIEYMIEGTFQPTNPRKCSWISMAKLWNASSIVRHVYALDRSVGMLRENANLNLTRLNGCFEVFFVVSWIIAKFLVYHCALKYIIALFGSESARAKYFIMTQQVHTYMDQRKFPPRIKKKILKFYAVRFQSHFFVESRMMSCVSGQLKEYIIMYTGRQLVKDVAFLKQLPRTLLLQIGLKLRVVIFIAGDVIFKINTIGDCLYFIDKGTVAIYSESGKEVCHLEDGDFFGEIALVMKHRFRTASAVAVTNCELFRLDRHEFESSIACYPTVYEDIKKVAVSRLERTCVIDEHHKAQIRIEEGNGKDKD